MVKDFLRIAGAACILSGALLYWPIINNADSDFASENKKLKNELAVLQQKLERTEGELANLQTLSSEDKASNKDIEEENDNSPTANESDSPEKTILHITPGTSSEDVANELEKAGIIDNKDVFNAYLKTNHLSKRIQIGEYEIDSSMTVETIAEQITN